MGILEAIVGFKRRLTAFSLIFLLLGGSAAAAQDGGEIIPLDKLGGVYHLPVELNGFLQLSFILDTGAAEMSIPANVVNILRVSGTLKESDILSGKIFILANGRRVESPRVLIRKVKIGNRVLRNVPATVSEEDSPLLLGQSLLEKVGSYTFDSHRQVLVLHSNPSQPMGNPVPESGIRHSTNFLQHSVEKKPTEDVVERFFMSVATEDFGVSWNILSTYSQNTIVSMVAEEADSPPEVIRELFENNHRAVRRGFWASFRDSSKIPSFVPHATYRQLEEAPGMATVKVLVGDEELRFEVYEEDGKWKLGLIESIERFRSLKK